MRGIGMPPAVELSDRAAEELESLADLSLRQRRGRSGDAAPSPVSFGRRTNTLGRPRPSRR